MKWQRRVLCALSLLICTLVSLVLPCVASDSLTLGVSTELLPQQMNTNLLPILTSGSFNFFSDGHAACLQSSSEAEPGKEYRVLFSQNLHLEALEQYANTRVQTTLPVTLLAEQVLRDTRAEVVCLFAQRFLGYRYVFGSQDPNYGFDCSGLMYYVYHNFGYELNRGATGQLANGRYVKRSELKAGDLVFFGSGSYAFHVGMYLGDGNFIHAAGSRHGVIISSLSEPYYSRNYLTARRIID